MNERPHAKEIVPLAKERANDYQMSRRWVWIWVAWVALVAASFALLEWLGLRRTDDYAPPLTQVIRKYAPRWVIALTLGGIAFVGFEHFVL